MIKYKVISAIFLLYIIFAAECNALIFTVNYFPRTDEIQTCLELWGDNHNLGSKEENIEQLKLFIRTYLLQDRIHLIIESKFFYGVDYRNINIKSYMETLSKILGSQFRQWSFFDSPQEPSQTTWIAWELPFVLLSIFSNEELPVNIELSEEQKQHIINNVTIEFLDPRMHIDKRIPNPFDQEGMEINVKNKFKKANNSSPEKIGNILSNYVESQFFSATNNAEEANFFGHAFDIEALSSIMTSLSSKEPIKKIVVLCGQGHAAKLSEVVPNLGFSHHVKLQLRQESKAKRKLF